MVHRFAFLCHREADLASGEIEFALGFLPTVTLHQCSRSNGPISFRKISNPRAIFRRDRAADLPERGSRE
jgi:hypothetical protein